MSALPRDAAALLPMTVGDVSDVMAIERVAYDFPWSRGNFIDSLAAGYMMRCLIAPDRELLGYFVAMAGVDEVHLLNITVAPAHEHRGHARRMLDAVIALARERHARQVWLEVRVSNPRAATIYEHYGFRHIAVRRGYYPAPHGQREDARVMSLQLGGADHGVD